jgi:hypothetical protein
VTAALDTLDILANSLNTPFLAAITSTTQSLLKNIQVGFAEFGIIVYVSLNYHRQ